MDDETYDEVEGLYDEDDLQVTDSSSSENESDADAPGPEKGSLAAEAEIETDFNRLIKDIKDRNGPSESGVLAKDWDINIEDREAEFHDDLRAASGIGKRKVRGRAAGPALSHQVRALIGEGNQAYVDDNLNEAVCIMQEVIRIEPRAASAWSVLAQCYDDMGQTQRALQLRIMAAHLSHDADEWERLARQSRDLEHFQQALYCYRKVYSLAPDNVDALWDRATLAKQIGDLRTTRHSYLAILKRFPHDLTVLEELRTILIEMGDLATCADLFQRAFDHYQTLYPTGMGPSPSSSAEVHGGGFSSLEILVLADLYNTLGECDKAITVIRRGSRWLQGRLEQKYWDLCEDDREYDTPAMNAQRPMEHGEVSPGNYHLDVNSRHRLAVARIKMGDTEEGKIHAAVILEEEALDYAPLFLEIADAYFEQDLFAEAKPIYEILGSDENTSSISVLLQTAACMRNLDELKEAAEVYEHVRLTDPTNSDAKMKLAEIYEILNEPRRALDLVYEVIEARRKSRHKDNSNTQGDGTAGPSSSLFAEDKQTKGRVSAPKPNKMTIAQLRQLEAEKEKEMIKSYERVQELWGKMMKGEELAMSEWTMEVEKMLDVFRETRVLFSTQRKTPFRGMFPRSKKQKTESRNEEENEERMLNRLQLDLENDALGKRTIKPTDEGVTIFRGVSFDDWLRIFIQYSFNCTQRDQYDLAEEILRHILLSIPFRSREYQDSIRLALITCAIHSQQYLVVVENVRKIINAHQFNNEPLRILVASLSAGLRPTDAFITSTLQKHLYRETKSWDMAVKNPEAMRWAPIQKRYQTSKDDSGGQDDEAAAPTDDSTKLPELPNKPNPVLVALYGQICIAAKSYQSAIFYLLHAYDYCPEDPVICLCLTIASIGRAMQRQADNRHHLIAQGMAFLTKYRRLRGLDWEGLSEVEYNFGRTFQQIGLLSHAVRHYEHVLEITEKSATKDGGLAREAAYNLSIIYVTTGAAPLAQLLYRRWLSF